MGATTERLPYRATEAAAAYERIIELPVVVLLDNIRSLYNVGAFFRTADATRIQALHLCGITGLVHQVSRHNHKRRMQPVDGRKRGLGPVGDR